MDQQLAIQNVLREKFSELQIRNPKYSLRAYAKRAGLSPGALSSILNGKRRISKKIAVRLAKQLMLDPQERAALQTSFQNKIEAQPELIKLTTAQFKMMADWEHFAILSLLNTKDFQSKPSWIAARLGISEAKAQTAIERLQELELITLNKSGKMTRTKQGFRTSDDIADVSIRKFHDQTLSLAKDALHEIPLEQRDFSAVSFAIAMDKIPEAKAMIRKFQDDLTSLLESAPRSEVYRFSCQLFPLTKIRKENPHE